MHKCIIYLQKIDKFIHTHNTQRLTEAELSNLLLGLREIKDDITEFGALK